MMENGVKNKQHWVENFEVWDDFVSLFYLYNCGIQLWNLTDALESKMSILLELIVVGVGVGVWGGLIYSPKNQTMNCPIPTIWFCPLDYGLWPLIGWLTLARLMWFYAWSYSTMRFLIWNYIIYKVDELLQTCSVEALHDWLNWTWSACGWFNRTLQSAPSHLGHGLVLSLK